MPQYLLSVHGTEDSAYATDEEMQQAYADTGRLNDGPYLDSKEHIGGFWVIDVADEAAALAWAEKATVACRGAVEVRPFQG